MTTKRRLMVYKDLIYINYWFKDSKAYFNVCIGDRASNITEISYKKVDNGVDSFVFGQLESIKSEKQEFLIGKKMEGHVEVRNRSSEVKSDFTKSVCNVLDTTLEYRDYAYYIDDYEDFDLIRQSIDKQANTLIDTLFAGLTL